MWFWNLGKSVLTPYLTSSFVEFYDAKKVIVLRTSFNNRNVDVCEGVIEHWPNFWFWERNWIKCWLYVEATYCDVSCTYIKDRTVNMSGKSVQHRTQPQFMLWLCFRYLINRTLDTYVNSWIGTHFGEDSEISFWRSFEANNYNCAEHIFQTWDIAWVLNDLKNG